MMKFLLSVLSFLYQSGCQIKNWLYKWKFITPKKAPLQVLSVGNISFGGTEKTPLVMNLISFLIKHNYKTALVSRGYKGKWETGGGILSNKENILWNWENSGDEPFMIAQNIPQAGIFIGKNRFLSSTKASQMGFKIAVLDDGFQHRRLHRDLDIVLYDPSEKMILRERFSSLNRAHILLVKRDVPFHIKKRIKERLPQTTIFEYSVQNKGFFKLGKKTKEPIEKIKRKKFLAFCGIARPGRFLSLLKKTGITPIFFLKFPDHHPYPLSSLEKIFKTYNNISAEAIITTEKDAVKIHQYQDLKKIPVYYLKIDLKLNNEFYKKVLSLLQDKA